MEVKEIEFYFDGSGDSGDIEEVTFHTHDNLDIGVSPEDLEKIKDLGYDIVQQKINPIGDWVNNDGGYGYLHLKLDDLEISVDFYQRTVEEYSLPDTPLFI